MKLLERIAVVVLHALYIALFVSQMSSLWDEFINKSKGVALLLFLILIGVEFVFIGLTINTFQKESD